MLRRESANFLRSKTRDTSSDVLSSSISRSLNSLESPLLTHYASHIGQHPFPSDILTKYMHNFSYPDYPCVNVLIKFWPRSRSSRARLEKKDVILTYNYTHCLILKSHGSEQLRLQTLATSRPHYLNFASRAFVKTYPACSWEICSKCGRRMPLGDFLERRRCIWRGKAHIRCTF